MNWETEIQDLVVLSFALEKGQIDRLIPTDLELETRTIDKQEYAFFNLGLCRCKDLHSTRLNVYSLNFPMAYLGICVTNQSGESCSFIKRTFAQGLEAFLMRWGVGLPTQSMKLTYPSRAHPGGEYFWDIRGSGVGKFRGRIQDERGMSGRMNNFFDSFEKMKSFLLERKTLIYGTNLGALKKLHLDYPSLEPYTISFGEMELGFLADDLERHTFPECIIGGSFITGISFEVSGPEKIT